MAQVFISELSFLKKFLAKIFEFENLSTLLKPYLRIHV